MTNHISPPWHIARGAQDAERILSRIEDLLSSDNTVRVVRRGFGLTLDVGALRLFFRAACGVSLTYVQYGYYTHTPNGTAEVVVGEWDTREAYDIVESLAVSQWSSHSLLQKAHNEIWDAVRALGDDVRLVDGAMIDKNGTLVAVNWSPLTTWPTAEK